MKGRGIFGRKRRRNMSDGLMVAGASLQDAFGDTRGNVQSTLAQIDGRKNAAWERQQIEQAQIQQRQQAADAQTAQRGLLDQGRAAGLDPRALLALQTNPEKLGAALATNSEAANIAGGGSRLVNGNLITAPKLGTLGDQTFTQGVDGTAFTGQRGMTHQETETQRANTLDHRLGSAELAETRRSNQAGEAIDRDKLSNAQLPVLGFEGAGGDQGASPFDNFGQFGEGGQFMPASFGGEDAFFSGSDGRQNSDFGPQRETPRPARAPGTIFDRKYDQEAGKRLSEWTAGGQARALGELEQLKGLIETLEGRENLSGPVVGTLPRGVRRLTNQRGVITQDAAEAIIQKTAKSVLGGQFTENEMVQLLRRSYDPTLPEAENARRMKGLYNQLVNEARNLDYMSRYAGQYGTTVGYEGQLPGFQDHERRGGHELAPKEGEAQEGYVFLGGDPADPANWQEQ